MEKLQSNFKIEMQDRSPNLGQSIVYLLRVCDLGTDFFRTKATSTTYQLCGLGQVTKVLYILVFSFVKCGVARLAWANTHKALRTVRNNSKPLKHISYHFFVQEFNALTQKCPHSSSLCSGPTLSQWFIHSLEFSFFIWKTTALEKFSGQLPAEIWLD